MAEAEGEHLALRLRKLDRHLLALLAERIQLAEKLEGHQTGHSATPGYHSGERLTEVRRWATERGLNPDFAFALFYFINDESSRIQLEHIEQASTLPERDSATTLSLATKRKNLLDLTERVAGIYDTRYAERFFATRDYRNFESGVIDRAISGLNERTCAFDFGCATGLQTARLASSFKEVVGFDVSPAMIAHGDQIIAAHYPAQIRFVEADLDTVIPAPDSSVSFVVLNLGTASELADPQATLAEISRLLVPGGRVFLSFYNKDALVYRINSVPWPLSLAAEMNVHRQCLEVHLGSEVFRIHARAYTLDEARDLLPPNLRVIEVLTHPTISPLLPNDVFEEEEAKRTIGAIDHQLSSGRQGNYLVLVCEKDAGTRS